MAQAVAMLVYRELVAHAGSGVDPFDAHVAAAILALASAEAACENSAMAQFTGLDSMDHAELVLLLFDGFDLVGGAEMPLTVDPGEQSLRDILWMHASGGSRLQRLLTRMIARRALRPNHLWQDLGLANRNELTLLMRRHFPRLAARNSADMKWKKFFYRMMCNDAAFTLCSAPVCNECDDFESCFGAEDGEALLARVANGRLKPASLAVTDLFPEIRS